MVTEPAELVMSMPSPVWPSRSTLPMVSEPDMPLRLMPSLPPEEVTELSVALSVVGLMRIAVPLFDVIWLVPSGSRMLTVPERLRAEAEGAGAVDGDVDAAVEIERAVGGVVGLQVDAVAVGAAVVEDGDQAAKGEGRTLRIRDRDAVGGGVIDGGDAGDAEDRIVDVDELDTVSCRRCSWSRCRAER